MAAIFTFSFYFFFWRSKRSKRASKIAHFHFFALRTFEFAKANTNKTTLRDGQKNENCFFFDILAVRE